MRPCACSVASAALRTRVTSLELVRRGMLVVARAPRPLRQRAVSYDLAIAFSEPLDSLLVDNVRDFHCSPPSSPGDLAVPLQAYLFAKHLTHSCRQPCLPGFNAGAKLRYVLLLLPD